MYFDDHGCILMIVDMYFTLFETSFDDHGHVLMIMDMYLTLLYGIFFMIQIILYMY